MRSSIMPLLSVVLGISAVAFSACAEGAVVIEDAGGGAEDASTPVPTSLPDASKETGPTCVSSCSADSECQNSCAPVSTGANCCDVVLRKCYRNPSSCPVEQPDAGDDGSVGPY